MLSIQIGLAYCGLMASYCHVSDAKTLKSLTSCYGNTQDDFVRPNCTNGTVIEIYQISVLAKKQSTGCPNEATTLTRDYERCCTLSDEDCKMDYVGDGMPYHTHCSGYSSCIVPVAWAPTSTCSGEQHLTWSNYMLMEYYCNNASKSTVSVEGDSNTTDVEVYLQNEDYPLAMASKGKYRCSLIATCDTQIVVKAIHLSLFADDEGECHQFFTFDDEGVITRVDCNENTRNGSDSLLTSTSYYLHLEFVNNYSEPNGSFWIEMAGTSPDSQVQLGCNAQFRDRPNEISSCEQENMTDRVQAGASFEVWEIVLIVMGALSAVQVIGTVVTTVYMANQRHQRRRKVNPKAQDLEYGQPPMQTAKPTL